MTITPEQFDAAYSRLPFPIREYIADDEISTVTEQIGKQYGLHIDTVGALDREITNMLLGFLSPAQFVGELKAIGVPEQSVGMIVKELNAKVFMPLREKMQHPAEESEVGEDATEDETVPAAQIPPAAPISPYNIPSAAAFVPATPVYVPPAPAYIDSNSLAAIPSAAMPSSPFAQPPVTATRPSVSEFSRPIPPLVPPTPPPAAPISVSSTDPQLKPAPYAAVIANVHVPARTMAQDMQAAQAAPAVSTPRVNQPQQPQPPAYSAPIPAAPTPTTPSTWGPPAATPPASPVQNAPMPAPQTANRDALHSVLKEYGVDPYREPPV